MEKLSVKVGQLHCESTGWWRCRSDRLPTPDTSRSSLDGFEVTTLESSKYDSARDAFMHSRSATGSSQDDSYYHKPSSESRNQRYVVSQTPPYHTADTQRPLLPPIKSILGDNLASPPRTPTLPSAPTQPVPREPIRDVDLHRPSSLYPNKRLKTESSQPIPPLNALSRFESRPAPAHSLVLSPTRSLPPTTPGHALPGSAGVEVRSPLKIAGSAGPRDYFQGSLPPRASLAKSQASSPQQYETLQPSSRLTRPETSHGFTTADSASRAHATEHQRFDSTTVETRQYRFPETQHAPNHAPSPTHPYPPPAHDSYRSDYTARHHPHSRAEYPSTSYPHDRAAEPFIQAPYEYSYPKTRKRSNLPKHSTEIMRAWFDQNIENPYPSEEQKALFASATGISMTQVSNWFINHRRRCPELRDRRSERRKI